MKKEVTFQEWEKIGNKVKEIRKNLYELDTLLCKKLPKTLYSDKWILAEKAFGKLRSHLDDIVCSQFPDEANKDVISIFYGKDEKK